MCYIPKGRCNLWNVINSRMMVHQVTVNSLSMRAEKGTLFFLCVVTACVHSCITIAATLHLNNLWATLRVTCQVSPSNVKICAVGSCLRPIASRAQVAFMLLHQFHPAAAPFVWHRHWNGGFLLRSLPQAHCMLESTSLPHGCLKV